MPLSDAIRRLAVLPVALLISLGIASIAGAAPAQVPCSAAGPGKYNCSFYVSGDGISAGAPVVSSSGARVGYLNEETDWIVCQQAGARQSSGPYYNHYWGWTEADNGARGWVSAVYASGGDNDGSYAGVPNCNSRYGYPPGATPPSAPPTTEAPPKPKPVPTPAPPLPGTAAPAPPIGTALPTPVNMGSYGTYRFRFQLWRGATGARPANFKDWTAEQMMAQLNSNFSHYFTFTGCGEHLRVGVRCRLDTTATPDAPVEVTAVAPTGFAFRALTGHPEGPGRTIEFQFLPYTNEAEISSMSLVVMAWGPVDNASLLGPINSATVAKYSWETFEKNITSRFPDTPPGGVVDGEV